MANYNTFFWIAGLIGLGLLMVYVILPRISKNYNTEKGIKLLIFYGMMGYLSYDFFIKEKYMYMLFFVLGSAAFTYLVYTAKRK
ncbi:MAG: hypothetical protein H7296_08365 [Bacteroidia bacterium]|nr:hypothetical protein [Bacteroidia bacterium]